MRLTKDLRALDRLAPTSWTLLFYVDDTGDETRTDYSQPFFGMGGCAVYAHDLEQLINQPWREVRRIITGSPDIPLHASELRPPFDPAHLAALSYFFADHRFIRFGVSCDHASELSVPHPPTWTLLLQGSWARAPPGLQAIFHSVDRTLTSFMHIKEGHELDSRLA